MSSMHVNYLGELRNRAAHDASNATLITDAPTDNQGKGESFSPTDLLCTSLATCMITIMGIEARKLDVPFAGITASVKKFMVANPRRISKIVIELAMPAEMAEHEHRDAIEKAGLSCPVALSLHPDVEQDIRFNYTHPTA